MPKWVPTELQESKMAFKSSSLPFYLYLILVFLEADGKQQDVAEQCDVCRVRSALRL